ncbi:hypothetical protein [Halomonas llamarensis]|uniref:Uncharacterized protein n=1 Tax=Halomonas llamarensis TaxID=2945104 RepID=A0ABT0SMB9_9GAMM|nr:hypothetical protein [Halomonas llamarensis]MCL7928934.1 hypothetical protein [Halomonas llamarensis]
MANRFWIPTLMAAALLLNACGESEEASNSVPEDGATVSERAEQDNAAASNNKEVEESSEQPTQVEQNTQTGPSTQAEQEKEAREETQAMTAEDVQADEDTLSADPSETLEEDGLPGEVTSSDVDDVIAETERRFNEAQQRLDEQFKEVENQAEALTAEELDLDKLEEDVSTDWETDMELPDSSFPDSIQQEGELGEDDVQAMIEETERRFEEAQQRLDEQFQELEEENPVTQESMVEENSVDTTGESGEASVKGKSP